MCVCVCVFLPFLQGFSWFGRGQKCLVNLRVFPLAHQNRTRAIAGDFRVDGAKSPEIPQKKKGVLGSEIAARNRKSLATFHRALKSQPHPMGQELSL